VLKRFSQCETGRRLRKRKKVKRAVAECQAEKIYRNEGAPKSRPQRSVPNQSLSEAIPKERGHPWGSNGGRRGTF